jgi:hypothetical protein
MRIGLALGATALLAAGAIGVVALATGGDHEADTDVRLPNPSPGPAPKQPDAAKTGIMWAPDALLPGVQAGGAAQATWAAEVLQHLDSSGNGSLEHEDGAGAAGGWDHGSYEIVDALVARYDTTGDDIVGPDEATRIGADAASGGWLSADAVERLRDELHG